MSILNKIKNNLKDFEIERTEDIKEKTHKTVKKDNTDEKKMKQEIIEFEKQKIKEVFTKVGIFCEENPFHVFVPETSLLDESEKKIVCVKSFSELEYKINEIIKNNKNKNILLHNVNVEKSENFTRNFQFLWNNNFAGIFEYNLSLEKKYWLIKNNQKELNLYYPYSISDKLFYLSFYNYVDEEDFEQNFDNFFKFPEYEYLDFKLIKIIEIF